MPSATLIPLVLTFIFSITCVVLGFVALLKQKVYIDSSTNQPTEVSLPIIGKLKTNYPALLFVLVGFVAMYRGFGETPGEPDTEDYLVTGRLEVDPARVAPEDRERLKHIDFSTMMILPFPNDFSNSRIEKNGSFSFMIKVPKASQFEERVQRLILSGPSDLIGSIDPGEARNNPDMLKKSAPNLREYRFLVVPAFPPGN